MTGWYLRHSRSNGSGMIRRDLAGVDILGILPFLIVGLGLASCDTHATQPLTDSETFHGQAAAKLLVEGVTYNDTWNIQITRSASFNPYDKSGLQDGWIIDPPGHSFVTPSGTQYWVNARCGTPEPREILGISEMQANAEPMETPGARQLTTHHPVTMRAPVYSLAQFRPEELLGCVHPVPTNVWADVTYSVGPDFLGPIGRHRLTWYDDLDVRVHKDQSASDADPDGVLTAAMISSNRGDYDTAVEVLTRAINKTKIQTAEGVGWLYIGYRIAFLDKAGRFNEAIVDYRHLLTIRPSDTGAIAGLAQELYKVGRSVEALPLADQAVAQAPTDLNLNLRAKINEQLGRRSEAITDYRAAMTAGKNESETKTAREALVRLGEVP
jgi:hypothetical protein